MMVDVTECGNCGHECEITGEYPQFTAFCTPCNDTPGDWDPIAYAAQKLAGELDTDFQFKDDV